MKKNILCILLVLALRVAILVGCTSGDNYPYGYEECFRCQGSGLINEGFIDFKTCPTCKGSGMLDSHD